MGLPVLPTDVSSILGTTDLYVEQLELANFVRFHGNSAMLLYPVARLVPYHRGDLELSISS